MSLSDEDIAQPGCAFFADTLEPQRDFRVDRSNPLLELLFCGQPVKVVSARSQSLFRDAERFEVLFWRQRQGQEPSPALSAVRLAIRSHPPHPCSCLKARLAASTLSRKFDGIQARVQRPVAVRPRPTASGLGAPAILPVNRAGAAWRQVPFQRGEIAAGSSAGFQTASSNGGPAVEFSDLLHVTPHWVSLVHLISSPRPAGDLDAQMGTRVGVRVRCVPEGTPAATGRGVAAGRARNE